MNNSRYWLMLVGATVSGLLAGYVALVYVSEEPTTLVAAVPSQTIVVAARDLPAGSILRREDVETVDWPGAAVPEGFASQAGEVVGRGLITDIKRNEALLDSKLAHKEAGGGLSITIPEGMRAVSVEVDEVVGVAGFVLPGTRVDVLVTVMPGTDRTRTTTRIILQNIRAIAADQRYQQDIDGEPQYVTVVTLLVTPEQSEELTLAATEGRIQLALRNTLDSEEVQTAGRRITSLLAGGSSSASRAAATSNATPVPADPERVIESYEGGRRTLLKFGRGGGQ
ncbi:MAG: Flp pilus assembly protein CpaB [Gemmatimonadetes bacterium]|nr:Flp pilus assembly protein CpaB [Gemmatimonadota bacterium]NNF11752.1 Flp pilus assembly protein CpaB [Gemmatimonadota bacterium]